MEKELLDRHIFSSKSASSLPFVLLFLLKKTALAGQAEWCSAHLQPFTALSNTENQFLVSDSGSEYLTWVTASAFLTF